MADTTQTPQPIIDLLLADINAVIPNFTSLVSSYRLLVGAAEEIRRTPTVCPEVFERAVRRYDNTGFLIDVLLELLCCKILFTSELLQISCAPIDLFRLIANPSTETDTSFRTAEQVVGLELLLKIFERCLHHCQCLPDYPVICPEAPPPAPPAAPASQTSTPPATSRTEKTPPATSSNSKKEPPVTSRLYRKHI